jgi:hypothetical protein
MPTTPPHLQVIGLSRDDAPKGDRREAVNPGSQCLIITPLDDIYGTSPQEALIWVKYLIA